MRAGTPRSNENWKLEMIQLARKIRMSGTVVAFALLLVGCESPDQRAQGYYDRGMALLAKGDDLNARVALTTSVKFKSDRIEAWRALAGVDERTRSLPSLFGDLRRIVELDPNDIDARIKLARMMMSGGASEAALKVLEGADEGSKPSAALHALKAIILVRTKDAAGAEAEARRALEIDPGNVDASLLMASKKVADGDADGALKLLNSLPATTDPQDKLRITLQKVQALAQKKDLPQAEALLSMLIAENPDAAKALRANLVQLYISGRDFEKAEKELRTAAGAVAADSKAEMDLVRFLISFKGPKVGRDELIRRIEAGGDVFSYQIALSELDFAEGHATEAIQQLQSLANKETNADHKLVTESKLAEIYVAKSNFAAAEPLIAEILKTDRRNTTGLRLRATIRIEQRQFDDAIADLREALNDQPKSADLLILMAQAFERSGKNELADRQYADALKASGQNPNIALQYVAFLQRRGYLSHAEDVLTRVSDQYRSNAQLLFALSQIRLNRKNWTGALALAETIRQLGNTALAEQIRAAALAGQDKIAESVSALESAHAAAPDSVQPVVSLVSDYLQLGKTDKADALLQEMHKKFPDNAMLLVLIGQTKFAQNKVDDAVKSMTAAIAKKPDDPTAYNALTNIYASQKNYDAALDVIERGLRALPGNLDFRLKSAGLQIEKGDPNAAISEYESILKDQPSAMIAINNLVSLILDNRSDQASLDRAFSSAEDLKNSLVPQFQDTYGWAQFKRGNYASSISALEAAQGKLPSSAPLHYHLGMSYAAIGQPEKAAEQFKLAYTLEPDGTDLKAKIRSVMKSN